MTKVEIKTSPLKGKVLSLSKDKKTAKIEIVRVVSHKKYGKYMHRATNVFADAAQYTDVAIGNEVSILPCRPLSKTKFWRICSINQKQEVMS
jgi:small subunit ribosomal protein S17